MFWVLDSNARIIYGINHAGKADHVVKHILERDPTRESHSQMTFMHKVLDEAVI